MLAIKEDDLEKLVKKEASHDDKIKNQNILTYGLKDASFQVGTKKANRTSLTIQTKVVAGPDVDEDQIKTEVMGKKRGEAEQTLKSRPGVKEVRIDTKPFWNYSIPKKSSKIKVVIEGSNGAQITD